MTSRVIEGLAPGSRVAVIRLRALGDCVLSTPAIHLLKQFRPDLSIAVVADTSLAGVFQDNPDISNVLAPSVRRLRAIRPDLVINFHGGTRSARLTLLSGAPVRAGYDMLKFGWAYNRHIPTAQRILGEQRPVHTAEHMASAMFYLGVPRREIPRARLFPPPGRSPAAPAGPYLVIHPAASRPDKMWPAERFLKAADAIGLEPVFIGGEGDDLSAFQGKRTLQGAPLGELGRLLRGSDLFLGNDSGPAHMAAAFGTPEVVLFGPSAIETWYPWRTPAEVLRAQGQVETITVEEVTAAALRLLDSRYDSHSTRWKQ